MSVSTKSELGSEIIPVSIPLLYVWDAACPSDSLLRDVGDNARFRRGESASFARQEKKKCASTTRRLRLHKSCHKTSNLITCKDYDTQVKRFCHPRKLPDKRGARVLTNCNYHLLRGILSFVRRTTFTRNLHVIPGRYNSSLYSRCVR